MWKTIATLAIVMLCRPLSAQVSASGVVMDQQEHGIQQARIKLEPPNPALSKETISDRAGLFNLDFDLPGGTYGLYVVAPGFQEIKHELVQFATGDNKLTIKLTPIETYTAEVSASIGYKNEIQIERMPLSETLTEEEITSIAAPRFNKLMNIIAAMPGITKDERGRLHPFGSQSDQTNYLLDGFSINDPSNNQMETRLGTEVPSSIDLFGGRYSVSEGRGSAILKINSGMGADKMRYTATNFFPGPELQKNKGLVLADWSPRLAISGPIIKTRLWFFNSFDGNYNKQVIQELPRGQDFVKLLDASNLLRFQANLKPTNILTISALAHYFNSPRSDLSPVNPPETTLDRRSRQYFFTIRDQIVTSASDIISLGYANYQSFAREIPQGHDILLINPLGRGGNAPVDARHWASRNQFQADTLWRKLTKAPNHQIKTGLDVSCSNITQDNRRTGYRHFRLNGQPTTQVIFGGNGKFEVSNCESAAYIQDRYSLAIKPYRTSRPWLANLEFGARFDKDSLLPGYIVTPRIGLTVIPARMKATKFSAGFGLMPAMTNLGLFGRKLDQYSLNYYFDENGQLSQPFVTIFTGSEKNMKIPVFSNLSAGVEQNLPANLYIRFNYLRTRSRDAYAFAPSWDKALIPSGLNLPTDQVAIIYDLDNRGVLIYDSAGITVVKKFHQPSQTRKLSQKELALSFTRSRSFSNSNWSPYIEEPMLFSDSAGRTPWDIPNRVVAWGTTGIGIKNSIYYLAEWHDGTPFSVYDDTGMQYGQFNSWRYPRHFILNINFERRFTLGGHNWAMLIGVRNASDRPNYSQSNPNISAPGFPNYFGADPRKIVLRIRWLGKK